MQFEQAKVFILDKLKKELPAHLSYHSLAHVLDVYHAAERIGQLEKIAAHDMKLLLMAALLHDSGFIVSSNNHEEGSCRIARQCLPGFSFNTPDIEKICGMIMATKLPQLPKNQLEEIIADADLDYLGRDDFFPISDSLFEEFIKTGIIIRDEDKWNQIQVSFFKNHHYFTPSALKLRRAKKAANLRIIKLKLTQKG